MPVVHRNNRPPTPLANDVQPRPVLQTSKCSASIYKSEKHLRCTACVKKKAGDTCRFQFIRFFLRDESGNVVGVSFLGPQRVDPSPMDFPNQWNIPLDESHLNLVKVWLRPLDCRLSHTDETAANCGTCIAACFEGRTEAHPRTRDYLQTQRDRCPSYLRYEPPLTPFHSSDHT